MAFRIAGVPLNAAERVLTPGGVEVVFRAYQPIVWVRLVPWGRQPDAAAVVFPAVVDTGNNHFFLIPGPMVRAWAGVEYDDFPRGHRLLVNSLPLQCYGFNLDLLRLRKGVPTEQVATRLQTGQGVAIIPDALTSLFPRMPVLGVRCLTINRITFTLNGDKQTFSLSQPQ